MADSPMTDAWKELISAWNEPQPTGDVTLNFGNWAFNQFHYQPGTNCGDPADGICGNTVTCGVMGQSPAAEYILNSIVYIHNVRALIPNNLLQNAD